MSKQHKINIKLPILLAQAFEAKAAKAGLTKSKILREWLENPQLNFQPAESNSSPSGPELEYSFIVDEGTRNKIDQQVASLGISRNSYIRLVLRQNLSLLSSAAPSSANIMREYWLGGQFMDIINMLAGVKRELTILEKLYLIRSFVELGSFGAAKDLIQDLERAGSVYKVKNLLPSILEAKVDMALVEKDVQISNSVLNELSQNVHTTSHRELIGWFYYQKGVSDSYEDRHEQALENWEKALEWLDIHTHPTQYCSVYLRMARYWAYQLDFERAQKYLSKVNELTLLIKNLRYRSIYLNEQGFAYYLQDKLEAAQKSIDESRRLALLNNSNRGIYYSNYNLAQISLFQGHTDDALACLEQVRSIESNFRNDKSYSGGRLLNHLARAKYNYKQSMSNVEKMHLAQHWRLLSAGNHYAIASTQFVYGDNADEQKKGEVKLREMTDTGSYPLLRQIADNTLKTKHIKTLH